MFNLRFPFDVGRDGCVVASDVRIGLADETGPTNVSEAYSLPSLKAVFGFCTGVSPKS